MASATRVLVTTIIYCTVPSIPCSFRNLVPYSQSLQHYSSCISWWFQHSSRWPFQCLGPSVPWLNERLLSNFFLFCLSYNFGHNLELIITNNSDFSMISNTPFSDTIPFPAQGFHLQWFLDRPWGAFVHWYHPPFHISPLQYSFLLKQL